MFKNVEIDCGRPPDLPYSVFTSSSPTVYSSVIEYRCDTGTVQQHKALSVCEEQGWTLNSMDCTRKTNKFLDLD